MNSLTIIEAILFVSPNPVEIIDLLEVFEKSDIKTNEDELKELLSILVEKYQSDEYGFELSQTIAGYSFRSKSQYHKNIAYFMDLSKKKKLSKAALETLSIIAFKAECTKNDIEGIRGVSSDYTVEKLLEKQFIMISGKLDTPGRPLTYTITNTLLDYLGIKSKEELTAIYNSALNSETI